MLWKLTEYEHNGYHDSDWYAVCYDDETNAFAHVQTGTTRFANSLHCGPAMRSPTPEILEKARVLLADHILRRLVQQEQRDILEPDPHVMNAGVEVVLTEAHAQHAKGAKEVDCLKCHGSGRWVHPRRASDTRPCFGCNGTGRRLVRGDTLRDEHGKVVWEKFEAGTRGVVAFSKAYGTFYRSGYNRPSRENTTVYVRTADGRELRAPLRKLRLAREASPQHELQARAEQLSTHQNWAAVVNVRVF